VVFCARFSGTGRRELGRSTGKPWIKVRPRPLESFLRQHYTSSSESAAILAAYLEGQEKPSADTQRGRVATHAMQTTPSGPTLTDFGEEIPRPPADIPDVRR